MAFNWLKGVFGDKPDVPELEELDLSKEQQKAIQANIAAAPGAARLSDLTADQIDSLIGRTTPNATDIFAGASQNIEDMIAGKIPTDVQSWLRSSDAGKALAGGFSGSGAHKNMTARDFGKLSTELSLTGISAAESWFAMSEDLYSPAISTFTNMFVTPGMQYEVSSAERKAQFEREWMKNQISAMPDPIMRGLHDTIMSLAVAYLGGNYVQNDPAKTTAGLRTPGGYDGGWGGGWNGEGVPPPAYGGYDAEAIGMDLSGMSEAATGPMGNTGGMGF